MPEETVGFIGLGIMGGPMALNLLRAGYPLLVHNRTREKEQEIVSEGAESASSPREVAARSEIVITMLPDSPDVEQVYLAEDEVITRAHNGQLLIDKSSIAPAVARAVLSAAREVGADALDAPVSGGDGGARDGTLWIEVLSGGLAGNRVMEVRRRNFLEHDCTPGFKLKLHHKDLGIALRTARELGVYCRVRRSSIRCWRLSSVGGPVSAGSADRRRRL